MSVSSELGIVEERHVTRGANSETIGPEGSISREIEKRL